VKAGGKVREKLSQTLSKPDGGETGLLAGDYHGQSGKKHRKSGMDRGEGRDKGRGEGEGGVEGRGGWLKRKHSSKITKRGGQKCSQNTAEGTTSTESGMERGGGGGGEGRKRI